MRLFVFVMSFALSQFYPESVLSVNIIKLYICPKKINCSFAEFMLGNVLFIYLITWFELYF